MKEAKNLFVFAGVCVLSAVLSFFASAPSDSNSKSSGEFSKDWAHISENDTVSIEFKRDDILVTFEKKGESNWWATYSGKSKSPFAEDETDDKSSTNTVLAVSPAKLKEDVWNKLQPFMADRVIRDCPTDAAEQQSFGLDSENTLVIQSKSGKVLSLKIGKTAYGSRQVYVCDTDKNKLLLISNELFSAIEKGRSRFFRKEVFVHDFAESDASEMSIGEKNLKFTKKSRDNNGDLSWQMEKGPENSVVWNSWFAKLGKLQYTSHIDPQSIDSANRVPVFTLSLVSTGNWAEKIELWKVAEKYYLSQEDGFVGEINSVRAQELEKELAPLKEQG